MKHLQLLFFLVGGFLLLTSCDEEDMDMTDDTGDAPMADVTITLNNVGSSAWQVTAVEGTDAANVATLNTDNPAISLEEGTRYRFINQGGSAHPLEFRNAAGDPLLVQFDESGSLEDNAMINYQEDSEGVTFTLTTELNDALASYFCAIHSSMNGSINPPDIVSLASATEDLSILVQAVSRFGDLAQALSAEGSFTVFAPTNAAFEAFLQASPYSSLDEIPDDVLLNVLSYHVIAGNVVASGNISDGLTAETVNGQSLSFSLDGGAVVINGNAQVIQADVAASNGIVHVIDAVLVPAPEPDATITISNVGASAWVFTGIDGQGATASLNAENATLTLTIGNRYRFINEGGGAHPLAFLDSSDASLLAEDGGGSFANDENVNFSINSDGVSFTLTSALAAEISSYICTFHGSMKGSISTQE
ncbi:MAG: fasciclin domain-containing protein [Cyclobacteriaceae bacterium]